MLLFHKSSQSNMVLLKEKIVMKISSRPVSRGTSSGSTLFDVSALTDSSLATNLCEIGSAALGPGCPLPAGYCSVNTVLFCRVNDTE